MKFNDSMNKHTRLADAYHSAQIEGPGYLLKPLTEDDFTLYRQLYTLPSIQKWIGVAFSDRQVERAFAQLSSKVQPFWFDNMHWVIYDKVSEDAIGITALVGQSAVEVGTLLLPHAQNKGVAYEVMSNTINYAFTQANKEKVFAYFWYKHTASFRLVKKLGFYIDQVTLHKQRPLPSFYCEKINKNRVSV